MLLQNMCQASQKDDHQLGNRIVEAVTLNDVPHFSGKRWIRKYNTLARPIVTVKFRPVTTGKTEIPLNVGVVEILIYFIQLLVQTPISKVCQNYPAEPRTKSSHLSKGKIKLVFSYLCNNQ